MALAFASGCAAAAALAFASAVENVTLALSSDIVLDAGFGLVLRASLGFGSQTHRDVGSPHPMQRQLTNGTSGGGLRCTLPITRRISASCCRATVTACGTFTAITPGSNSASGSGAGCTLPAAGLELSRLEPPELSTSGGMLECVESVELAIFGQPGPPSNVAGSGVLCNLSVDVCSASWLAWNHRIVCLMGGNMAC